MSSTLLKIEALWLSGIEIAIGHAFHEHIFSIFSVMARWIAEMLFMLFFVYIAV